MQTLTYLPTLVDFTGECWALLLLTFNVHAFSFNNFRPSI